MSDMVGGSAHDLQDRFGIAGAIAFEKGAGGLIRAAIAAPGAEAHVYLHGAHVTHFQRRGQAPLLFLSPRSTFAPGRAIRGGVPIVFPWFGANPDMPAAPQHGFARVAEWMVESAGRKPGGETFVALGLTASAATRSFWPGHFHLRYRVSVGESLDLALEVTNHGAEAFAFQEALHSYLAVSDVTNARVTGLEDTAFIDKTDGMRRARHGREALRLTGETDRVFLGTSAACTVEDPGAGRRITVAKSGARSTIVWNPWAEKAATMADLGPEAWRGMLCVEAGNVADDTQRLAPGERHELRATITAGPVPEAAS
jgi:glucose-6-phosphate 1-epimerase